MDVDQKTSFRVNLSLLCPHRHSEIKHLISCLGNFMDSIIFTCEVEPKMQFTVGSPSINKANWINYTQNADVSNLLI